MKKVLKSCALFAVVVALALCAFGCTSFIRQPNTSGGENGTTVVKTVVFNSYNSYGESNELSLKEAYAASSSICLTKRTRTRARRISLPVITLSAPKAI